MDSRREFLRKAALLSGAGGLANILPETIQRAMAINPAPGSSYLDAEHIVFLMQENRSFDHCFGTLKGVRGFNDPRAVKTPNGANVLFQPDKDGNHIPPFRMDIKDTKATWMSALPHGWSDQVDARNHGKYDRWVPIKRSGHKEYGKVPMTMGYYNREDIPFYYALADAFTVCDQHFCSSLTGTTPNRLYFWTGTIREKMDAASKANVWNSDVDYGEQAHWKTYPEVLEENGVSWKIYQNEISVGVGLEGEGDAWLANFTDNPIEWFSQYHVEYHEPHLAYLRKMQAELPGRLAEMDKKLAELTAGSKEHTDLEKRLKSARNRQQQIKTTLEKVAATPFSALPEREQQLHKKAFTTNIGDPDYHKLDTLQYKDGETEREVQLPKGDVLHQLRQDVKNGQLPAVSWVVAPENFSDHPGAPWYGAWYLSEVMDILTSNPEVWKKTIFVLTYDENDGYFDHVPPFTAPDPSRPETGKTSAGIDTSHEWVSRTAQRKWDSDIRESSIGLGYRVPMVIASPWSRGGYVNSQVFDHTSNLQFLEVWLGHKLKKQMTCENITAWRRAVCGDLTSVFRPYNGEKIASPASIEREAFIETIHNAKFKAPPANFTLLKGEIKDPQRYLPLQEKGIRPACAIPYELYAHVEPTADGLHLTLESGNKLFGKKSAGGAFNVYGKDMYNRAYAVNAGAKVEDVWGADLFPGGDYDLAVYGPNGFYRGFKGKAGKFPEKFSCKLVYKKDQVQLVYRNQGASNVTVQVKDAYHQSDEKVKTIKPGSSVTVDHLTLNSHGWYDLSVTLNGGAAVLQFAGHVETGKESFSDPVMGGVM
ncbi:phosphocholine-specific phospholipase C [Chitinophaga deserti]|uniref:phosphocholine-specific phospholipase C n=1 Tax=Chitinophaga deserti TaxID=2164099 RepID=UPI000D6D084E|nr:phospholipase C, phosphocholine-specific [Chitinophaga deserti]